MGVNKKLLFVFLVIASVLIFTIMCRCSEKDQETYDKYGLSFKYPADMTVIEEDGVIGFSEEISEIAGNIVIESAQKILKISWMGPFEDADRSLIERILLNYRAGVEKSADIFFIDAEVPLKKDGHLILGGRLFVAADQELLRVIGAWYCDESKRIFIIDSGAPGDPPKTTVTTNGRNTNVQHDWTNLKNDASYQMIKSILRSITCH